MDIIVEKSVKDSRGYWIIDKSQKEPRVLRRIWAMPSEDGKGQTYDIYELDSSAEDIPLYLFDGHNAGYFRIAQKVQKTEVDGFMKSKLEKTLAGMLKLKEQQSPAGV